jgi:N-acetyltransferase 10
VTCACTVQAYCNNVVDHHLILDLTPTLAAAYFCGRLPVSLTAGQAAILVMLGLQRKELGEAAALLHLPSSQALALFLKTIRGFTKLLQSSKEGEIERSLPCVDALKVRLTKNPFCSAAPLMCRGDVPR